MTSHVPSFPKEESLLRVIAQYRDSFSAKAYEIENDEYDPLMDLFGITPDLKRENRQYWGRELGMCWQLLVAALFRATVPDHYSPAYREGRDELCDFVVGKDAIDTKYRIGSGDSGTLKKFKQYGKMLNDRGFRPVLLIVREDNLPAAIKACMKGGWNILTGPETFEYVEQGTGVDLQSWFRSLDDQYAIARS